MELNLERIVRFCVVAEEMSFTRAARRLNVDQAWLSRQVQQLEEQLGFRLFERTTRKVTLTEEGSTFLAQAVQLASVVQQTKQVARSINGHLHDQLRVGVSQASFWMPEREALFAGFLSRFPNFKLEITTNWSPRMVASLESHKIDLALTTPITPSSKLEYLAIHRSTPGLLIPVEMPLANRATISMADLAGYDLGVALRKANPISFDNQFGPFLEAGMKPRVVPEGRLAIFHYAALERMPMLGHRDEVISGAKDFIYRDVEGCSAIVEIGVVRLLGDERAGVRRFWSVAQEVSAKSVPVEKASEYVSVAE